MTRYRIYCQSANGHDDWTEISPQIFLGLTEGTGAFKKDTVMKLIKEKGKLQIQLNFKLANPRSFEDLFDY